MSINNSDSATTTPTTSSDFARYVTLQTLSAISFPQYDLKHSLRFWIKDFKEEVQSAGITNMDHCCIHIARFMPTIIRTFITSIPPTIKNKWSTLTEELLLHFGRPEEEENRELLTKLRK
ncbi:uncharacterized protein EV154DRAFT_431641, partial [Mucor mucedo]|uniref:uncharacterized protein n=1 Tax=Mucor mucedo TaxID=29922 RepID=UPI002221046A